MNIIRLIVEAIIYATIGIVLSKYLTLSGFKLLALLFGTLVIVAMVEGIMRSGRR